MALATRCPHCQTAFRVASDQLKLRAGLVRCGTCKQIFNGIENLLRPDEDIAAALAGAAPPLPPVPTLGASEQDTALPPPRGDNTRFNDLIAEVDFAEQSSIAGQEQPTSVPAQINMTAASAVSANDLPLPGQAARSTAPKKGYAADYAPVPLPAAAVDTLSNSGAAPSVPQTALPGALHEPMLFAFDTTSASSSAPGAPADVQAGSSDALWAALGDDPALHEPAEPDTFAIPDNAAAAGVQAKHTSDTELPASAASATGLTALPDDNTVPDSIHDIESNVVPRIEPDGMPAGEKALPGLLRAARIDADEDVTLPVRTPLPRIAPALPEPPADIPDFLAREQQEQGTQRLLRPALWSIGALAALLLTGQLVYAMRSPIAASLPQTRAALDAACRMLGCLVALPMQIESVSIESSDFQPVPDKRDQFMLGVVLRNRSTTVEAWPAIELSLNDASDKTVGRRVIMPREYLPPGLTTARGFAAGSEQALKVYFDLARLPASGYRVYLFYP